MTRKAQVIVLLLLAAVVAMGGLIIARSRQSETAVPDNTVVVFAPCGLTGPLNVAIARFRATHPEMKLEVVFDNANVLVRKIRKNVQPDIFISPGELEIKQLADEGFVDGSTIRDWGSLDIVVYAPSKTKNLASLEDLTKPHITSISMADPKYNSIGYYGEKALRNLGLWEPLQTKLRLREYPLEAVKLVSEGTVDAGVTFLTCPLETAPDKASSSDLRVIAKFPADSHPPVRLQIGMLKTSQKRELGQKLIDFIASEDAQDLLSGNGVLPIKEIR